MIGAIRLPFVDDLQQRLETREPLIQVVLGPRQVGKTTGVKMLLEEFASHFYATADGAIPKGSDWLVDRWAEASAKDPNGLFVVDEIQKVEQWSETIKRLWDAQDGRTNKLRVVLLGSSSLSIQTGLSESLAGRYLLHRVWQWSPKESERAFGLSLETFLRAGGYPGSYRFLQGNKLPVSTLWLNYLKDAIVEAVIGRDILLHHRVKSPALFRQAFDLANAYGGQVISYTKLLGQLQDKGNTDLIRHYLDLFEGAFLLRQLHKYSTKPVLRRTSSPKLLPNCPALYALTHDGDLNSEERGRAFEIVVGNALTRKQGELYYWRERKHEVDYVYRFRKRLIAIEVKSGRKKNASGLAKFQENFPNAELLMVTPENYAEALARLD